MSESVVDRSLYREVLVAARRFARTEADARDLLHDALEIAVLKGVDDWASPERRAWLRGVVRKRAAFVARSNARRERRERLAGALPIEAAATAWAWDPAFLASLPPSLRSLATFASADLGSEEIRWLLALTDTALRQRLSGLRRALAAWRERPTLTAPGPLSSFGPRRSQVLAHLRRRGGRTIATQDPDGHVVFFQLDAHKPGTTGNP